MAKVKTCLEINTYELDDKILVCEKHIKGNNSGQPNFVVYFINKAFNENFKGIQHNYGIGHKSLGVNTFEEVIEFIEKDNGDYIFDVSDFSKIKFVTDESSPLEIEKFIINCGKLNRYQAKEVMRNIYKLEVKSYSPWASREKELH